jgi:hypothetical protein
MNNADQPNHNQPDANFDIPPSATENDVGQQPATQTQLEQAEEKIEKRMSAFERSMLRLTWAAVTISVLSAFIFAGQLYEMWAGGTQTDKLVNYAKTQSEAADAIAGASSDFTDSAYWIEQHMDDAANAMQDSVDTAERNARITTKNAQEAFRDDQRAWIGLASSPILVFNNKDPFKMEFRFVNSGKTPGVFCRQGIGYDVSEKFLMGTPSTYHPLLEDAGAVAPSGAHVITVTNSAVPEYFDAITKDKTRLLYFWSEFQYQDVYRKGLIHTTKFCVLYDFNNNQMGFCPNGNTMD